METKAKAVVNAAKEKMKKALDFLESELTGIRAGKANPAIFNGVFVDYYGSQTPLAQVASITSPDARTIIIQPWEKKLINTIEKAVLQANLGFNPQNNGESIRINVPPLTEERRKELVKKAKQEGENAKIGVRNIRRETIETLKKYQKEGLGEDLEKDFENEVQKLTDEFSKKIDKILENKEKEIMAV